MTTFCERQDFHPCGADIHVTPETTPRRPYAVRLEELKEASESLQQSIARAKEELKRNGPELDPYMMQYRDGSLVLIPMLADQITILNQIEKLEREEQVRKENLEAFEQQMEDSSRWINRNGFKVLIPDNCLKGEDCLIAPDDTIVHAGFCPAIDTPLRPFEGVVCLTEIKVYSNTVSLEGPSPSSTYLCTNRLPCPDHPQEKSL